MDDVGLVTSLRYDQLLLLSKDNANFAPPNRRPCPLYILSYHRDRILAAAEAAERTHSHLEGDQGLDMLAIKIQEHLSSTNSDDTEALKVCSPSLMRRLCEWI